VTITRPAPIDPRGPRFNQTLLSIALMVGFIPDWRAVVPVMAVVLFLGAALGPRWGPFLRLYATVVRPRLGPPAELEDPRPPRFAAVVGVVFLTAASLAFAAGAPGLGWALALIVAALAGLAASTGICVGCELWLLFARRRGVELVSRQADHAAKPPARIAARGVVGASGGARPARRTSALRANDSGSPISSTNQPDGTPVA